MNYFSKINLFFVFFLGLSISLNGQITLSNASFEGNPNDASMPTGWHHCKQGTTPDILPGPWGVIKQPYEGETFLGLITREDGTWESVEQRLSQPMKEGYCYNFDMMLAYSKRYAGYNLPLKLRIWGSAEKCGRDQLLAQNETP